MTRSILVVGAGIVGVSSAIWLRRFTDAEVTVIDRAGPGEGTSHGNGGVLAACGVAPVTGPGLIRKAPGMLLDPDVPLYLRWSYLPRLAPWLRRYLGHANAADSRRISRGLAEIVGDSVAQHKALVAGTGAEDWVTDSDYSFAYTDRAAYEAEAFTWSLRRDAGFVPQITEGAAVREREPNLAPSIGFLATLRDHGYIRDPGGYVRALARVLEAEGGHVRRAEVRDVEMADGRVAAVLTDAGRMPCDALVLATGVWSKPLMKKLGLSVPLETERGYHIVFRDATGGPSHPVMIASGKFVATPMAEGLRCAGILEFAGLDAGPSAAPLALMRRHVRAAFPNLSAGEEIEWLGHRPAPSDSLPLIGEVRGSGVFSAFGHHHIGLTGGPKTGRLVAGLVAGKPPNADLAPFDPMRFA